MCCAATPARRSQIAYNSCRNRHCPKCQAQRRAPLARSAAGRPAAGGVLPRGVHPAGADQRDRLLQQGGDLRPAVRRRRRDAAHHRRRSEASRRADRRDAGAAHLGLGADAPSACARHRSRRRPVARRRTLGRLQAGLLPAGARALAAVPPALPRRTRDRPSHAASCSSSASTPRWPIARPSPHWLAPLRACEWVVYAKRPFAGPAAVLAYLSRYTHRVAISNQRLLALDERGVTFRWKDYRATGTTRYKTMTLGADEFMRRFLLHVLPGGFHRIRHYGLLANAGRREHLAQRTRAAARRPRRDRIAAAVSGAVSQRPAHLRLPALWCGDDHHRDLRPRPTDPCTTHVASCSMITGIGCPNASVRSSSATADSGRLCLTLPKRRFSPAASSTESSLAHRRHPASARCHLRSAARSPHRARTANHQIPIAV